VSHRISKHQLKHDEFSEDMVRTVAFIKRYSTEVLAVSIGVLVIIMGLIFIGQNRAKSEREAGLQLNAAHGALLAGNFQQALEGYKDISSRFGSTNAGQEALAYLGNLTFQQRNFPEAQRYYQSCVKANPKNPLILSAALSGLAACAEQSGDLASAGGKYLEVASRLPKEEYLATQALLAAGRCFGAANAADKAKAAYQKIVDLYPDSPALSEAKAALSMLPNAP
jgi:TolA-binding protein